MNAISPALQRFGDVTVRLSVELGRTDLPLRDVLALGEGSVVPLNRLTDELLDVTANGKVIARGEVVAQDGRFALRIVSLAGDEEGAGSSASSASASARAMSIAPSPAHAASTASAATASGADSAPAPATETPPPPTEPPVDPLEEALKDLPS